MTIVVLRKYVICMQLVRKKHNTEGICRFKSYHACEICPLASDLIWLDLKSDNLQYRARDQQTALYTNSFVKSLVYFKHNYAHYVAENQATLVSNESLTSAVSAYEPTA